MDAGEQVMHKDRKEREKQEYSNLRSSDLLEQKPGSFHSHQTCFGNY